MNRASRGFSLIEVMLGGMLALLFISSISLLLVSVFRSGQVAQQTAEISQNAHYVTGLLRHELEMAGFYGELDLTPNTYERPDFCSMHSAMAIQQALLYPVDGINGITQTQRLCGSIAILPGSDVLLLRQGLFSSESAPEQVSSWKQSIYYVSNTGSFKRQRIIRGANKRAEPMIEGVDDFQIEYGIRIVDAQGTRTVFVDLPGDEQQWRQLVAIRFHFLLSSDGPSPQGPIAQEYRFANKTIEIYDDKQRSLFTGLSRLQNLAPKTVELESAI